MKYIPTIGLEIHAALKTKTKMFCSSKNDSEEKEPNVNICPICMGHPGTLPVINKEAVKHVLKVGVAVGGELADFTEFDRKNYFYPDIPKGYQISQYKFPLVKGGNLHNVQLTRVHLEEDTATLIHPDGHQRISADKNLRESASLVNFNRAGVPLMELVTEPVITNAQDAVAFAKELQLLLQYLNVSDANMEKGEMRVEANVSVAPINADTENTDKRGLLYEDLSYKIRGAAFSIYNALGSGHKESVYQNSLMEHFKKIKLVYEKEKHIPVKYENKKVGSYQPDFVIDDKIILEIKALPFIGKIEKEQVMHYLKNSSYRLAMIINFGSSPIHIERIVYDRICENLQLNPRKSAIESATICDCAYPRKSALGVKVEIKNLNSFKSVERAIEYEIARQTAILEKAEGADKGSAEGADLDADEGSNEGSNDGSNDGSKKGERVIQETRGWDENKGVTFSQRLKEESHDYRYFPDPDLPKLFISEIPEFKHDVLADELPELPSERRKRYQEIGKETESSEFKINSEHIEIFVTNRKYGKLFDETFQKAPDAYKLIANYIGSDIVGLVSKFGDKGLENITPEKFAKLIIMFSVDKISSRGTKDILKEMFENGGSPEEIAKEKNLLQTSDTEILSEIIEKVIGANSSVVSDYRAGKEAALQYLVGQGMKESKGSANPGALKELLKKKISAS